MLLEAQNHSWARKSYLSPALLLPNLAISSCKLCPGGWGGWILLQGRCGGGKEVPSQAGEREACQNCCGGFPQGSRGMTGTLSHHGPGHEALQCSHLLQLCQHIWTQTLAQGAVSGDGFIPARAQLCLCCHKSMESNRAKMSWQPREAQWGSRTVPLPLITAPRGWN